MKILFLTQICPYPPSNGGAIKTYNILKHLGSHHEIDLLMFIRHEDEIPLTAHLSEFCTNVDYCTIHRSKALNLWHAARSMVTGSSFIINRDFHPKMQQKVQKYLEKKPDLIYVDHLQMAQFVPSPAPCPVLLDEHNVEWRIIERFASADMPYAQRLFASIEWKRLRSYELEACKRSDHVLAVTQYDAEILADNGVPSHKVSTLPIGVDLEKFKPVSLKPDSRKILSFGTMSWPPNIDAVSFFCTNIYPLVKRRVHDAEFTIVGANPPSEIKALAEKDSSVKITGFVPEITPYAEEAAVFVVPLRIGSGMRVKILDAMALGLPIVTTNIGCEGINLNAGEHAVVADNDNEFADAVINLLNSYDDRRRLASSGRRFVESYYSWPRIFDKLDQAISSLVNL